jgi:G6PDH family F420-dependent oxidoreductase
MVNIGYTLMCEQTGPRELVRDAEAAERAGFGLAVISDHYFPWLDSQGHAPYAWSVLGAVSQATEQLELMTYVTCPTMRYHPVVVAQKAATMGLLSDGRFTLGLGAGENLNEHVVGERWPAVGVRHAMLVEATKIIGRLLDGDQHVNFRGEHFDVEQARLWDLPARRVPIGIAVSGQNSCALAGEHGDMMIATEPKPELGEMFDAAGGAGKPRVGQIALSYDPDREAAIQRAHQQFRWFGLGWKVNADLPNPESFDAATAFVTPQAVADQLGCGPDVEEHVEKIRPFLDAGFTEIALVQIGGEHQTPFIAWAQEKLLPALRSM